MQALTVFKNCIRPMNSFELADKKMMFMFTDPNAFEKTGTHFHLFCLSTHHTGDRCLNCFNVPVQI